MGLNPRLVEFLDLMTGPLRVMRTGTWIDSHEGPGWWVNIQRDTPTEDNPHIALGPYETEKAAHAAMEDSLLVQSEVETDCVECWVAEDGRPAEGFRLVQIDPNDPDHRGGV